MSHDIILSGGIGHPFSVTSRALCTLLAALGRRAQICDDLDPELSCLANAPAAGGLLVVNALRWRMHGEKYADDRPRCAFSLEERGRERIRAHLRKGGGLLAIHTAGICFDDWSGWRDILGGAWVWGQSFHPPLGAVHARVRSDHPLVAGLCDFELAEDEVYSDMDVLPDVEPLLYASNGDALQPLLWAREALGGRVVYCALGHGEKTFAHPTFRRVIARSALFALARNPAEADALIDERGRPELGGRPHA